MQNNLAQPVKCPIFSLKNRSTLPSDQLGLYCTVGAINVIQQQQDGINSMQGAVGQLGYICDKLLKLIYSPTDWLHV